MFPGKACDWFNHKTEGNPQEITSCLSYFTAGWVLLSTVFNYRGAAARAAEFKFYETYRWKSSCPPVITVVSLGLRDVPVCTLCALHSLSLWEDQGTPQLVPAQKRHSTEQRKGDRPSSSPPPQQSIWLTAGGDLQVGISDGPEDSSQAAPAVPRQISMPKCVT